MRMLRFVFRTVNDVSFPVRPKIYVVNEICIWCFTTDWDDIWETYMFSRSKQQTNQLLQTTFSKIKKWETAQAEPACATKHQHIRTLEKFIKEALYKYGNE